MTCGACADFVVVPAQPGGRAGRIRYAAGSRCPLVYVTAWHSLMVAGNARRRARCAGGGRRRWRQYRVGADRQAGGGRSVHVVAGNAEKAERARLLGADWVVDRTAEPEWSRAVFAATHREGIDLVVDNVGQATWPSSLRTLRVGGRLVTVGGTSGYTAQIPINLIFGRQIGLIGSTMGTQADYLTVMDRLSGKLTPVVDSVFQFQEFRRAIEHMSPATHVRQRS